LCLQNLCQRYKFKERIRNPGTTVQQNKDHNNHSPKQTPDHSPAPLYRKIIRPPNHWGLTETPEQPFSKIRITTTTPQNKPRIIPPPPYTEKLSDLQIIGGFLFTKYEDFTKTHFKDFSGVFSGAGVCR